MAAIAKPILFSLYCRLFANLPIAQNSHFRMVLPCHFRIEFSTSNFLFFSSLRFQCKLYRNSFSPLECELMREKVTASSLFKGRKASYERSVGHPFIGDYLRLKNNIKWKKLNENSDDNYIVFADLVNKISTSGKVGLRPFLKNLNFKSFLGHLFGHTWLPTATCSSGPVWTAHCKV